MTLSIPLSAEVEARLRERAAADGKDVAEYVLSVVEEDLAMTGPAPSLVSDSPQQKDQWEKALDAWAAGHPRLDTMADDSRDSIYEGCGE